MKKTFLNTGLGLGLAVLLLNGCGSNGGTDDNQVPNTPDTVTDYKGRTSGVQASATTESVEIKVNLKDLNGIDLYGEAGNPKPYILVNGKKTFLSTIKENYVIVNNEGDYVEVKDWQAVFPLKEGTKTTGIVVMYSLNLESGAYEKVVSDKFSVQTKKAPVKPTPLSIIGTWKTECVVDNNISLNNIVIFMDDNTYTSVENEFYNKECKGIAYDTYEDKGKYKLGKATKSYQGKDVFEIDITSDDNSKTSYFMINISKTYIELAFALNGKDMDEDEDGGTSSNKRFNDFSASLKFYKD